MTMGNAGFSGILLQFKIYGRKIKKRSLWWFAICCPIQIMAIFAPTPGFHWWYRGCHRKSHVRIDSIAIQSWNPEFLPKKKYNGRICVSKEVLVKPPPLGYDFVVEWHFCTCRHTETRADPSLRNRLLCLEPQRRGTQLWQVSKFLEARPFGSELIYINLNDQFSRTYHIW